MPRLKGKTIVVTGGAGTIGRVFVRAIAEEGGVAVIAEIDLASAEKLATELAPDYPGLVEAVRMDITDADSVSTVLQDVARRKGRLDGVVNNAYPRNANYGRKLEEVNYQDFCQNVGMHLGGYFLVAQQACLLFRQQGLGALVNMSSIYGSMVPRFEIYVDTPMTMPVEYAAIKSAVEHLTRYFASYFKGAGIRVNSLSPGGILAAQPQRFLDEYNRHCTSKGMLNPQDIAQSLIYLLSDDSLYVTGQNLIVDDGFSL